MQYIALLRGVNVGGNRMIAMADLRQFATNLGLTAPRTLLQSGNLVFGARKRPSSALEELLEAEAQKRLKLQIDFMVRAEEEWADVIHRNPFPEAARHDPSHLIVFFFKAPVRKGVADELMRLNPGPEFIRGAGRELYIVFPEGMGTSKLPAFMTEKRLGTRGTARNWNTVLKLQTAVRQDLRDR